jgi:iron(III) transport system permease protein
MTPLSELVRPGRPIIKSEQIVLFVCLIVVAYLAGIPLLMLIYGSFSSAPIGEPGAIFTLQHYAEAYLDWEFYRLLLNSFYFAVGTCALSFLLGTLLAWVTERTNTPLRSVFAIVALIPFFIPGVLNTIAWILLFSPKIGLINLSLSALLGLGQAPFDIYSMGGMIWAESIHGYPLVFLMMSAAFRNMDSSLEDAASTAGANGWQSFRKITLPLVRPAVLSVVLITFIRAIETFEVPALIGMPARISVMTTKIYLALHQFPADFGLASAYAVTLLVISAIGIVAYGRMTRSEGRYATVSGKNYRPRVVDLGSLKYVTCIIALLIFLLSIVCPLGVLIWSSLIPYYGVPSAELFSKVSLDSYSQVMNHPLAVGAFQNSILLALGTASCVMLLTSVIAWVTVRTKLPGRELLASLTFLPIGIPGIVLGVSLLWLYLTLPLPIYGTLWILLIAYVTKFLPYGVRATSASMVQINKELEEAGAMSGGSWSQVFRKVVLPLLTPGFVAGWIFISIVSLRELSTSILLYSFDNVVLSVLVFDMWENGEASFVAALGVLMVLVLITLAYVARRLGAKFGVVN